MTGRYESFSINAFAVTRRYTGEFHLIPDLKLQENRVHEYHFI
jgi:hypothetical protein